MEKINVLIAGESWVTHSIHIKGVDEFTLSNYGEGIKWLKTALDEDEKFSIVHIPNHLAIDNFPYTHEELSSFHTIILSDIGSNTLYLPTSTAIESKRTPNRLSALEKYVHNGGSLCMVGGYMSFQGINGKARYHGTPVEKLLPTSILPTDDRVEFPEGITPIVTQPQHAILQGIPEKWPFILGFNQVTLKKDAIQLVECNGSPLVSIWDYGNGRSMSFTTDCAPHWAPPELLGWKYYGLFWRQAVLWLCKQI